MSVDLSPSLLDIRCVKCCYLFVVQRELLNIILQLLVQVYIRQLKAAE